MPQSSSDTHDLDGISSEYDNQPSVKRPSSKESIIYVSDTSEDEMNPNACAKGLDDELLRTINLLNSKAGMIILCRSLIFWTLVVVPVSKTYNYQTC